MDLITHGVVGLALGSLSGGNVLQNPLALGSLIGSIIPDGDIIYQLKGDSAYLKNHRGASHSIIIGTLVSIAVSVALWAIFRDFSFGSIFLWTFMGYMLHISLDILNSYGASIFWPFNKKKIESGLLLILDPVLLVSAGIIYFNRGTLNKWMVASLLLFIFYLGFRWILKHQVYKILKGYFDNYDVGQIVVMPSMLKLFKWDFISYEKKRIVTGQVNIMSREVEVRDYLKRSNSQIEKIVMNTPVGKFFKDFSPHYHIKWIEEGENHKAIITDLRYYIKGDYLHRATALFNQRLEPVFCSFQPYHSERKNNFPI